MKTTIPSIGWLLPLLAALGAAGGCASNGEDFCKVYCDCVDCSSKGRDVCIARFDAEEEIAGVYDCDGEYNDVVDCQVAKSRCFDGEFNTDECAGVEEEYNQCKD